jgi:hypothetical protein
MKAYSEEPAVRAGTAIKCGACLALVALVAVIGARVDGDVGATHRAASATAYAPAPASAEAHRKTVLDERRARFEGASSPVASRGPQDGASPHAAP